MTEMSEIQVVWDWMANSLRVQDEFASHPTERVAWSHMIVQRLSPGVCRRRGEGQSRTKSYETLMVSEKGREVPTNRSCEGMTREVGRKPDEDGVVKAREEMFRRNICSTAPKTEEGLRRIRLN